MALAQDLMGLGENPLAAARMAGGGSGPVTLACAGTNAATATQIGGTQFMVYVNSGPAAGGVQLPANGGIGGPLIYDNFVVHNGLGTTMTVYPPTGVTLNVGGSNVTSANGFSLTTLKTLSIWTGPTTTQWFGLSN